MTKKCVYTSFVCLTLILAAPPKHSSAQPAASSVRPAETLQTRVTQFVALRYHHGIPYEQARSLGPGALPTLKRLLADENYKSSWTNIVIEYPGAADPTH